MTTNKSAPLEGKILSSARKASNAAKTVSGADALGALQAMVGGTVDYLKLREAEQSKRAQLAAYTSTELRKIEAAEEIVKDYFRQAFAERKENTEALFARYDEAIARGDAESAHVALQGVVDLARTSPLNDLGDLGQIRKALDDQNHTWQL